MRGAKQKEMFIIFVLRRETLYLKSVCLFVHRGGGGGGIFGDFQKTEYFWEYKDFVNIFWASSQNWTILRGYYYAFLCLFCESQGTEWRIFLGVLNFQIFIWGAWNS